jgi:hypothetical protein
MMHSEGVKINKVIVQIAIKRQKVQARGTLRPFAHLSPRLALPTTDPISTRCPAFVCYHLLSFTK